MRALCPRCFWGTEVPGLRYYMYCALQWLCLLRILYIQAPLWGYQIRRAFARGYEIFLFRPVTGRSEIAAAPQ